MSKITPDFFQTLTGFSGELSAYKTVGIPIEEEVFYTFGPINIFVGANSSGKSRFLRALFKNEIFTFLNEQQVGQIADLFILCQKLFAANSSFRFKLQTKGNVSTSGIGGKVEFRRPDLLPGWAGKY